MASEPGGELHYSSARIRPTLVGWSLIAAVVMAALMAGGTRISYGFVLVLIGVAIVDLILTRRAFDQRTISVTPLVLTAEAPEQLAVTVSVGDGARLTFTPLPFSPLDGVVPTEMLTFGPDSGSAPLRFPSGPLPSVKRHVRFLVSASVLGFVHFHWTAAYVSTQFFSRIPEVPDLLDRVQATSVDEVGRVREYLPGDRRSRVSWVATARTGTLHVRDEIVEESNEVLVVAQIDAIEDLDVPETVLDKLEKSTTATAAVVAGLLDQEVRVTLRTVEIELAIHDAIDAQVKADPNLAVISLPEDAASRVRVVERVVLDRTELVRRVAQMEAGDVPVPAGPYLFVNREGKRSVA